MADFETTEGLEHVVGGSEADVYDHVYIPFFQVNTPSKADPNVYATVQFRHYRIVDGQYQDAPMGYQFPQIQVNLSEVLGGIEGGADLYEAVTAALIGLGKGYGVI